ncbi:DUF4168 domain-containing protein [Geitlerinema splendidum]|nr:DUF4168 domain-containing protein [Geitlerinema splendidum]
MIDRILSKLKKRWIWAFVLISSILCMNLPVFAQDLPQATRGKEQTAQSSQTLRLNLDASTIPAQKVSQFAKAYLQVLALIEGQQAQLHAAETEVEFHRKEREIQDQAFAIIEQVGLTKSEYLQLLNLANIDPEFGERVAVQLQEISSK